MVHDDKTAPRSLQQQPAREGDSLQRRAQAQGSQVEGEGSYTATRAYQKNIREYLDKSNLQSDADTARPKSDSEAREIEQAEREGRSHSKGER
jgi:hypothetical protein